MESIETILKTLTVHQHNTLGYATIHALKQASKAQTDCIAEIEAVACGEKQIECDGVYNDSDGLKWIYDRIQALTHA
ncbi:hypothetical protein LCGC14_1247250 [marine sediment metagenome]|uniref:Uncharacterized protein n=1 Tax=marine sediment metagenome TaxID=412755 RepID=A0A0F9L462_9ZZZZ